MEWFSRKPPYWQIVECCQLENEIVLSKVNVNNWIQCLIICTIYIPGINSSFHWESETLSLLECVLVFPKCSVIMPNVQPLLIKMWTAEKNGGNKFEIVKSLPLLWEHVFNKSRLRQHINCQTLCQAAGAGAEAKLRRMMATTWATKSGNSSFSPRKWKILNV